jgi:hypothetical protein
MSIDRRTAIRNFLMISAGVVFVPSCLQEKGKASIVLKNIDVDANDEKLLAEVCETFIPKTDTPGAKDISAHLFVLKMLDDCTAKADQQKILKGLRGIDKMADKKFNTSFVKCTPEQRQELFKSIESKQGTSDDVDQFYKSVKKLTIQAYTTSKYYLTNVHIYELVPARFHGCVPVGTTNTL